MSHYKPYPAYKDSDIEWIGAIPAGWLVKPLFAVAEERSQANKGMLEDNLLSLSYGNIVRKDINSFEGLVPESYETYQIVERGDVVFRLTDLQNDKRSLRSAKSVERGIITSAYLTVNPKGIQSDYFSHLMRSYDQTKVFYSMGGGMRQSMKYEDLRRMMVLLPSDEEQSLIANDLSRETTRIDALITRKTRFIELLREKRQALITHAVTKGLDPNVKMKDSGVEWLGEVPEHWEVKALKYVATPIIGLTYSPDEIVAEGQGTLVLRSSNIQGGKIVLDDNVFVSTKIPGRLRTRVGDIVICSRNGSRDLIGKNGVVDDRSEGQTFGAFTTAVRSNFNDYLFLILNSALFKFQSGRFLTTTINQLTTETLKSFELPLPPRPEQISIIKQLRSKTSHIDTLLSKTERSIELLKERRSALITAAVTGQIDLREAA
jgi:type I restriction enzyme S subunit